MKVKIFTTNTGAELELKINEFLASLEVITVRDIKYCFNDTGGHSAIILYSKTLRDE